MTTKEILSKYKEIIGGKDERNIWYYNRKIRAR